MELQVSGMGIHVKLAVFAVWISEVFISWRGTDIVRGRPRLSTLLTPSDFHFLNQNVLAGAMLFFWNQYSNIVRTKLSSTALNRKSYNKKVNIL